MLLANPSRIFMSGRNKNTNGQTFVISSSVHVFKRPFLVKLNITHRQVTGNEGERSNVVFGLIGFDLWHIHQTSHATGVISFH